MLNFFLVNFGRCFEFLPISIAGLLARSLVIGRIRRCSGSNAGTVSSIRCGGFGSATVVRQTTATTLDGTSSGRSTGSLVNGYRNTG